MGPTACPETSIGDYRYSLRNSPEERTCHTGKKFKAKSCQVGLLKKLMSKQFRRGSGCDFITHSQSCLLFTLINFNLRLVVFLSLQFQLLAYIPVQHICDQEDNHVSASFT